MMPVASRSPTGMVTAVWTTPSRMAVWALIDGETERGLDEGFGCSRVRQAPDRQAAIRILNHPVDLGLIVENE